MNNFGGRNGKVSAAAAPRSGKGTSQVHGSVSRSGSGGPLATKGKGAKGKSDESRIAGHFGANPFA